MTITEFEQYKSNHLFRIHKGTLEIVYNRVTAAKEKLFPVKDSTEETKEVWDILCSLENNTVIRVCGE